MKRSLAPIFLLVACSGAEAPIAPVSTGDGEGAVPVAAISEYLYTVGGVSWDIVVEGAFAGETSDVRAYGGTDETVAHQLAEQGCIKAGRVFDPTIPVRLAETGTALPQFVYDKACLA